MAFGIVRPMDWSLWIPTFGLIFAIIDPFGYVPVFLAMTADDNQQQRNHMLLKACVTAFVVLVCFTFLGESILGFFAVSIPALQISGGLILLVIGFGMLSVSPTGARISPPEKVEARDKADISIVPLAIPMLAGPASMTTVVVLASKEPTTMNYSTIIVCIFLTLTITYWVLRLGGPMLKFLGLTGLNVMTRIMGLLMCAMAVQFIIDGYVAIR